MLEKVLISLGDPSEAFVSTKYHYVGTAFDFVLSKAAGLPDTHCHCMKICMHKLHRAECQNDM